MNMLRQLIIDCDMGTDDTVALCMALFDERYEVLAVTAAEGCVSAAQANRNLQAVFTVLDPDRYPRMGMASPLEDPPEINPNHLYGRDGLGNAGFDVPLLQHHHPADKVIVDCVRANPNSVTIVCMGPLTNLAKALRREPDFPRLVGRIVMTGGALAGIGNVTPVADFNFYFDPLSAHEVVHSLSTKTLVPLDVTSRVQFGMQMLNELPSEDTRVGSLLRRILPYAFRSFHQQLGRETITLNDAIGMLALMEPQLFEFEELACDVETEGALTRGMAVFDRRQPRHWRPNMEVAVSVRAEEAKQYLIDQLVLAARAC